MHIWTIEKWRKYYNLESPNYRSGLRLKFDRDVHPEVKRACKEFAKWMRREYFFPIRVPIYLKSKSKIKALDGEMVYGTCFEPLNRNEEPYIRIAVGDYYELIDKWGDKDSVLAAYLKCIAHELTHYFQWINDIKLTEIGKERQAAINAKYILEEYAETRDHP